MEGGDYMSEERSPGEGAGETADAPREIRTPVVEDIQLSGGEVTAGAGAAEDAGSAAADAVPPQQTGED